MLLLFKLFTNLHNYLHIININTFIGIILKHGFLYKLFASNGWYFN
jgi:hypothetical protein